MLMKTDPANKNRVNTFYKYHKIAIGFKKVFSYMDIES